MLRNRPELQGALLGFFVTVLCVFFFFVIDAEQKLELLAFDLRMRYCNTLEPSAPIVHVDIDDGSLERVGRWPWHRDQMAEIIRELHSLGAEHIILDLLLSEHEEPYVNDPRYSQGADLEDDLDILGEVSDENWTFGDMELADAIRSAGNVILAIQLNALAPRDPDPLRERLRQGWSANKAVSPTDVIGALKLDNTREQRVLVRKELLRLRLRDLLLADFVLTDKQLAEAVKFDVSEVSAVVAGVKTKVATELVGRLFTGGGVPGLKEVLAAILGEHKDRDNRDRHDVVRAYWAVRGMAASAKSLYPLDAAARPALFRSYNAVPPFYLLAQAARGVAAVNFSNDADNGVRRVPLIINHKGQAIAQMGFAAACDILSLDIARMRVSRGGALDVPYRDKEGSYTLPLDRDGTLIIHWTRTGRFWRRGGDFPHVSAAKIGALIDARRQIEANETTINYKLADVIAFSKGELKVARADDEDEQRVVRADNQYRRQVNRRLELERQIHMAVLRGENETSPAEIKAMQRESRELLEVIRREQGVQLSTIEMTCAEINKLTPEEIAEDPELPVEISKYEDVCRIIEDEIPRLRAASEELAQTAHSIRAELSEIIRGKYVFLGFAATAEGDIVATPIDPRTNGVMCHAQVLNSLLQRRFITRPHPAIEVLLCCLLGIAVSIVTGRSGPRFALLMTLALILAYALLNAYVLFMRYGLWVALVAPVVTVFVTWAFVTLFRQFTAERQKRFFAKQLGQYTSPAIAAQIAASPEAAQAFKTVQSREVTCFFSDLKGFTTISEQAEPPVVQYVLNTYLERMSEVIWQQRGLINKFMGDGIMAFFNPSVDPQPDHAQVAAETTLLTLSALEDLRNEQRGRSAGSVFEKLHMRVGIATGMCMNGDLGSELKADYTVIGDVVNLTARLEPANKVFGTQIMLAGSTYEVVRDRYDFRYLAELQVVGKTKTVPVFELVCRKGELTEEQRAYIERFEAGVELYKQKKWDACIVHFTRLLARKFDDAGASRYIDACQELKTFPPEDDWNGALELKEK